MPIIKATKLGHMKVRVSADSGDCSDMQKKMTLQINCKVQQSHSLELHKLQEAWNNEGSW